MFSRTARYLISVQSSQKTKNLQDPHHMFSASPADTSAMLEARMCQHSTTRLRLLVPQIAVMRSPQPFLDSGSILRAGVPAW
jgi:hypothetical protein